VSGLVDSRPVPDRKWIRVEAAAWLSLAAAPTFALMAFLAAAHGGVMPDMMCSAAGGSPLSGMGTMYALMSAFHLGPWLRLLSRR
jgi:hypothetical protein